MAAEMITGLLVMSNVYKQMPAVSMLITKIEASYFKKATGIICFICEDGNEIRAAVDDATKTGESKSVIGKSIGKNQQDELVAEFLFTWSFKVKSNSKSI